MSPRLLASALLVSSTILVPTLGVPREVAAADSPCTVVGTPRSDRLVGTAGRDVICGRGGNDQVVGRGGNDVLGRAWS